MKGLIIFKGKYGATEQYAKWLCQSLELQATAPQQVNKEQFERTEFLLIGTSIYVGKFQIKGWLQQHLKEQKNKKLFFFIVTGTPLNEKDKLNQYIKANIPEEIQKNAEIFFLPGHLIFNKLSWLDKLILKMGASGAKDPEVKKRMLTDYDNVKIEHLSELLSSVNQFSLKKLEKV